MPVDLPVDLSVDPPATASVDTRHALLVAIRTADEPRSIEELAAALDRHPNTVRSHLAALVAEGLVEPLTSPAVGRGRPRISYQPTRLGGRSGERNYRLLAQILVDDLVEHAAEPSRAARNAGNRWGRQLLARWPEPGSEPGSATGSESGSEPGESMVPRVLGDLGFEPQQAGEPGAFHLHNCPFRELVDVHQEVVCALHAGIVEGLVESSTPVTLTPFASPRSCLVRVG